MPQKNYRRNCFQSSKLFLHFSGTIIATTVENTQNGPALFSVRSTILVCAGDREAPVSRASLSRACVVGSKRQSAPGRTKQRLPLLVRCHQPGCRNRPLLSARSETSKTRSLHC